MNSLRAFLIVASAFLLMSVSLAFRPADSPQQRYVDLYSATAVREMYRSGVPASITLAQGLLESRYGLSELAAKGNNHFGIKCHDWKGKKQYADDDRKGECFRVYDDADESFRDHSDFLRYRDRYKFLFDNPVTDYTSWAYGLKKAGYATDPAYPQKLIRLIEDYDLAKYDRMKPEDFEGETLTATRTKASSEVNSSNRKRTARSSHKTEKASRKRKTADYGRNDETVVEEIPESPLILEQPVKIASANETRSFSLSRQKYSMNGVPFIYALKGETIASIASANNLFVKELLRFNDMKPGEEPEPGDVIYLQAKKKATAKGMDKYIADSDGETLQSISQRFCVRLSELCKKNLLPENYVLREGDTIILR